MHRYEYVRRDQQLEKERAQQVRANRKHKRQQDQAAEADDVKRQKSPAQEAQPEPEPKPEPEPIAAAQTHTVRFVTRGAHVELAKPASSTASGEEAMVEAKAVQACTWVQVTIYEGRKHQVFDFPSRGALCARRHTVQRSANARVLFHH